MGPENLSIQILPWSQLFELLYTPRIGSLPCPEKFEYTVYANDQEPDLGPEFLSIQVLPGPSFFEYLVYARNQEPARILKI